MLTPLLILLLLASPAWTQEWSGQASDWLGFVRHDLDFEGHRAVVVAPERELMGRPWIWRARFFGHQPQADLALLDRGFHLAYVDVAGRYGDPVAVDRWHRFQRWLVSEHGFARRPVIEGMSRGGIIALNYARAHPQDVAALILDAPVCDLRSWPGGLGQGTGSAADWAACKQVYGVADGGPGDTLALANPLDDLAPIVEHSIPVLAVVGTDDVVVPVAENTDLLQARLLAAGGRCDVIRKPGVGHHPHSLEDPAPIVAFALEHGLDSRSYARLRQGLPHTRRRVAAGHTVRVAFLGGSITAMTGWRDLLGEQLPELFPAAEWTFLAAGIPSLDSTAHAFRLQRDVLAHGPIDLLFVEAAVNDLHNGRTPQEQIRGLEGVVRHTRTASPGTDVVVMHFVDPGMFADYEAGRVPPSVANHEQVAAHYGLPSLHLAREVAERLRAGQFTWDDDFKNLHPSPFGHRLYARSMLALVEAAFGDEPPAAPTALPGRPAPLDPASYADGRLLPAARAVVDGDFVLDPDWAPTDDAGTRPGFVHVPVLSAHDPGDELSFRFRGTAIGLFVIAGPDAGRLDVQVDDRAPRTIDLFTRWSAGLHLPWVHVLEADLTDDDHVVTLRLRADHHARSTGHAARIAAFLVNG